MGEATVVQVVELFEGHVAARTRNSRRWADRDVGVERCIADDPDVHAVAHAGKAGAWVQSKANDDVVTRRLDFTVGGCRDHRRNGLVTNEANELSWSDGCSEVGGDVSDRHETAKVEAGVEGFLGGPWHPQSFEVAPGNDRMDFGGAGGDHDLVTFDLDHAIVGPLSVLAYPASDAPLPFLPTPPP